MSTYAKSLLFLLIVAVLGVGAYVVVHSDIRLPEIGKTSAAGPVQCDFNGITYEGGQSRAAGDGCNTCVCTETGWSCTRNACFEDATGGVGTVSGALGKFEGEFVTDRVCAVDLENAKKNCIEVLAGSPSYSMRLPVGRYWIYAEDEERDDGYKAYYSEFTVCKEAECKDRSPIEVEVKEGEIAEAHPTDWTSPSWIDRVTVTPSQRKYGSNYYKPGSNLNVRAKNLTGVELRYFFIKLTAQDVDTDPKLVGEAVLDRTDEKGWQYWRLEVPEGFASSQVWPVGRDAEGNFMKGWDLGRTKQDETFEEKID